MIPINQRYCDEHKADDGYIRNTAVSNKLYDEFKRDTKRTSFYQSKQWERMREYVFNRDFGQCAITGRIDKTIIVDHIIPLKVDESKALDENNLWLLSLPIHNEKTRIEQRILAKQNGINMIKHLNKDWWIKQRKQEILILLQNI